MPIMPIIAGAAAAYGAIKGGMDDKRRRKALARSIATLRASRPTGYLTPEDRAASELTRSRYAESAGRSAQGARYEAIRRYQARGMGASPAMERTLGRIGQQEALGRQEGARAATQQLYDTSMSREDFERQKELAIFGVSAGDAANEARRADLKQATFMNSLLEFFPSILPFFGGGLPTASLRGASGDTTGPSLDPKRPAVPALPGVDPLVPVPKVRYA